tara:strand:+ start:461 stop:634 length:174 start_codon:yes stop_codon:yes gene_type:complete
MSTEEIKLHVMSLESKTGRNDRTQCISKMDFFDLKEYVRTLESELAHREGAWEQFSA